MLTTLLPGLNILGNFPTRLGGAFSYHRELTHTITNICLIVKANVGRTCNVKSILSLWAKYVDLYSTVIGLCKHGTPLMHSQRKHWPQYFFGTAHFNECKNLTKMQYHRLVIWEILLVTCFSNDNVTWHYSAHVYLVKFFLLLYATVLVK